MTEPKKRILVIVAHPDDETIGMGGTISKLVKDGDSVDVISMTDGVSSRTKSSLFEIQKTKAQNMPQKFWVSGGLSNSISLIMRWIPLL